MILEDVQNRADSRGIAIDAVGISGLRYPISVLDQGRAKQDTVADISLSVGLSADVKGTHLSRFIEVLDEHCAELNLRTIPLVLQHVIDRLKAPSAQLTVDFPYFLPRSAPVTGATALMDYACRFRARASTHGREVSLQVATPVTSVCPCSKAISDYGAHNQRGLITVEAWPRDLDGNSDLIWIEDLISIAETSASSPVYPLLKRADERHVTMAGYDNPVFVEDMAREAAQRLLGDDRIRAFTVEAVNDESIHNHGAFARIDHSPPELRSQIA